MNPVRCCLLPLVLLAIVGPPSFSADLDLLKAASAGDGAAVKKFIAQNADVNYQHGNDKITPLMIAAMRGRKEMFELLLNSGAHPNLTDKNGATAANYILFDKRLSNEDHAAMQELLKAKGGTIKNMDAIQILMFYGGDPRNVTTSKSQTVANLLVVGPKLWPRQNNLKQHRLSVRRRSRPVPISAGRGP